MSRLNCKEVILEYLDTYLDGSLDPVLVAEFERHLALCPACVAYLRTYVKTRELVGRGAEVKMPEEIEDLVRRYLVDRLGDGRA